MATHESKPAGPVRETERIVALDLLRGLAVLGILVTNIQHFAMFAGTTRDPTLYGDLSGANFGVYALTFLLFYQKFLPIFSMLFGAGIVLAAERREAAGLSAAPLHYRRMFVLLLIGLVHAYLIWYGDILVAYALCGMVVFLFRRQNPATLFSVGVGLFAIGPVLRFLIYVVPSILGLAGGGGEAGVEAYIQADLDAFRGSWLEQVARRAAYSFEGHTQGIPVLMFWRAGGLMTIGMALFKLGILTGRRSRRFYAILAAATICVALPLTILGFAALAASNWDSFWLRQLGEMIIYFVGVPLGLGYTSLLMLAPDRFAASGPGRALGAVGRMALTNYLMHSLICTFLFYGHGLGWYGSVERTGQLAVVGGVWVLQLIVSPLWLRRFRFGPAEWVWRSLAYRRLQPFRREAAAALPS
jgi:uncharacterized protein